MNALELVPIPIDGQAFALQVAIGGVGVCALVLALAALLRRRSEPLRYGILLTGVIGLLAIPALVGLGRSCQDAFAAPPEDEVVKVPAAMLPELLKGPVADLPAAGASPADVGAIVGTGILALWALGTFFGICRLVHALWRQRRALAGVPWAVGFWTDATRAQLAQKLGLKRFPAVQLCPAAPMPMVIGIWRPTIVLPEPAPATWEQPQWEAVLLHEAAHIARGDHWAVLAQRCAVMLFWWCPLVYVLARRLNELRENICDDCALQGTCDRIAYAELLLESAEHFLRLTAVPAPLGLLDSARRGLEARVTRLLAKEKPTMIRLSLPGKVLGAVLLVTACLLTTVGTAFSGGQSPPQKKIQIKIIVDGKEIDLGDALLLEHIEAAQQKAEADIRLNASKALAGVKPAPAGGVDGAPHIAISPDGKIIATGDAKHIIVWDAVSGKIVGQAKGKIAGQGDQANPEIPVKIRVVGAHAQGDPRIEDLVKQAEAIKPGSGDDIRRALQAAPKPGDGAKPKDAKPVGPLPTMAGIHVFGTEAGKKVIILAIEDGKVQQLNEGDLKKLVDKGIRFHLDLNLPKQNADGKARAIQLPHQKVDNDKIDDKKSVPATPAPDLEALSRQLERLNAEVNDLRKRLEAGKK